MTHKSDDPHTEFSPLRLPSEDILDTTIEEILGKDNPSGYSVITAIERSLRQFHLSSRVDAAEVLAEAYLRGKKLLKTGQVIHQPYAWLRKTAFNIVRERSRQLKKEFPQEYDDRQPPEVPTKTLIEQQVLEADFADLRQALKLLAAEEPEGAKLLHLRFIHGLSWQQIYDTLLQQQGNVANLATLRQRASRAKKRLRHIFHTVVAKI